MRALVFQKNIPHYVAMKLMGAKRAAKFATASWARWSPVSFRDLPDKSLPTRQWVRVAPRLSGICGSDLGVICAKGSPYFSPLTSTPFVLGHEIVGVVTELGEDVADCEAADGLPKLSVGDRVILEPALGCKVRGIAPMCPACTRGQHALCRNVTRGDISAGVQTGYCRDTGGGWAPNFVAHRSQLLQVPDEVSDAAAVLTEPLACVLHGVFRVNITDNQTVLVVGCGSIGLLTIAALRASGCRGRIVAVAKHPHQATHARKLGADVVMGALRRERRRDRYTEWSDVLHAELHFPELGKPTVVGGADVTFDCLGSSESLDETVRFTTAGGEVVLVGMPGIPSNIDWTAIWYKELSLRASYAYGLENTNGSVVGDGTPTHTCELALRVLKTWGKRLEPLVGEPFALEDHRRALASALFTGPHQSVKTVFRID